MKKKKAVYFNEELQAIEITPIVNKNYYYIGELKPKVIKRIKNVLQDKMLYYAELSNLLSQDKKFKYVVWLGILAIKIKLKDYNKLKLIHDLLNYVKEK